MKLGSVLRHLHALELELAAEHESVGGRHAADHDVHHLTRLFAWQCRRQAELLAPHVERLGAGAGGAVEPPWSGLLDAARRADPALADGAPPTALRLLGDLRALALACEEVSLTCLMVVQAAQAARDAELLAVARTVHAELELQATWLVTRIKTAAPQTLAVG